MPDFNPKKSPAADKVSSKGLDIILFGSIAAVFFLVPVFFTGFISQGLGFEKLMLFYFLVLLGVVAWVIKGVITGELALKRTPLDIPILVLLAVFGTSTILSVSVKDSLIGSYGNSSKSFFAVLLFALFYYLVVNNLDAKRIKLVFWSAISSISLITVFSFFQLMGWHFLPVEFTQTKSFNPLGSLSALTAFLTISLPLLTVAATQISKIAPGLKGVPAIAVKSLLCIVTLLSLVILLLLNGFVFWPITIVGMVIVLMFFLSKVIKTSSNNLLIPLFTFLVLIIMFVLGNFNFVDLGLPAEVSLSRGASWEIAKKSLADNPLFGSGLSTFEYDFAKYKSQAFNGSPLWNLRFDDASGIVYELLATVGSLGFVSILILMLIILSVTFITLIKAADKGIDSMLLGGFGSFISAIMFAVLFPVNNPIILFSLLISVFTFASAMIIYPEKTKTLALSFRSSAKYALALAAIFLCVSAGVVVLFTMGLKMYIADVYARKSMQTENREEKAQLLAKSISLAPYQDVYHINIANNYLALANMSAMNGADQTVTGAYLSQAIESGKKGVELAPNKAANNESLALIYENASFYTRGALEWSESFYNRVIELDPVNPVPYLRLALVNMARSNAESDAEEKKYYINEAIKMYDKSIEKKSDLSAAFYGKAIAYERLDNKNEAIEQMKQANLLSNKNMDYRFDLGRLYFNRGVSQPNLSQNASQQIAENDIQPEGEEGDESGQNISVTPSQPVGNTVEKNEDLKTAEQIFLSILLANNKHVNAMYSLGVLYKKVGENDKAKQMVNAVLDNLTDEEQKKQVREQFADIL